MLSTMQDRQLLLSALFEHGRRVHSESRILTYEGDHTRVATFAEVGDRTVRLAAALRRLGVRESDRVATLCWNTQEHVEAYFAVPSMGAVLHTANLRLSPAQLAYTINHAEDRVVIVDDSLAPLLAPIRGELPTVEHVIVVGSGEVPIEGALRYEELLAAEEPRFEWPEMDERSAASLCYTTGTTGDPKGVAYSHRSIYLHGLAICAGSAFGFTQYDCLLAIVPLFHANGWGMSYMAWMAGADFLAPGRYLQPEHVCRMIAEQRPTFAAGVPTVWQGVLAYADAHPVDLSSIKKVLCGGAAIPRALMEGFEKRFGLEIIQGWGMTETSPAAALAFPPRGCPPEEAIEWRLKSGRVLPGIELRIVDDEGRELPWDGAAVGEIEVRGPWVTASYYKQETPEKFHDGWLRTGDIGSVDPHGFVQLTDRAKDVIKSGGEWISSIALENAIMEHPAVREAAVVGMPDPKWDERPLACVVLKPGASASVEELRGFLDGRVAKWWIPERWAFIDEVPKTSAGKFDKKALRARAADGLTAHGG